MRKFALCPVCLVASTGFKFYGKDAFGPNSPGQSLVCAPTGVLDFVCRKILSDLVLGNVDKMEPHDACRSIGFCLRMDDQGRPYPAGKDMPQLLPKKSASPAPPAAPAAPGAPASAPVVSKITPKHEDDDDDDDDEDEEARSTKNEHKEDDDDEDADDEDDEFPSSRPVPSKTVLIINPEPITTNTLDKIAPLVFVPISVEPTASRPEVTAALSMPYAPSTTPSSSARLSDTGYPRLLSETPSSAPVTPPSAP